MSETTPRGERHVGCQHGEEAAVDCRGVIFLRKFMRNRYLENLRREEERRARSTNCLKQHDSREAGLTLRRRAACPFVQCAVISNGVSFCD